MIVTIDGPAGAGKSSVAKELARRLGGDFLDTGAMYRCIALLGLRNKVDWEQPDELFKCAQSVVIEVKEGQTYLNGENVEGAIRTREVTQHTKYAADHHGIRRLLVDLQRQCARQSLEQGRLIVTEGRDQGTEVFPNAELKVFLTASAEERAKRRLAELQTKGGKTADYETVLREIVQRDEQDEGRTFGALKRPKDAFDLNTDGRSFDEVVGMIEEQVRSREWGTGNGG
ncbi:MAG: (d)CMP kinase [Thermoguttaceae bacterium]